MGVREECSEGPIKKLLEIVQSVALSRGRTIEIYIGFILLYVYFLWSSAYAPLRFLCLNELNKTIIQDTITKR